MGTYSLAELIQRWSHQDLTPDQVIGQMLQVLQDLIRRVEELEDRNRYDGVSIQSRRQ